MQWQNFDELSTFSLLKKDAERLSSFDFRAALTAERVKACSIPFANCLTYNYAAKVQDAALLETLQKTADEAALIDKYRDLLAGENVNTGENRKVLHQLLRGDLLGEVYEADRNIGAFYKSQEKKYMHFADDVRSGKIAAASGAPFTHVVQIGIGGSDLGPRALYIALQNWAQKNIKNTLTARFISNVDPDDAAEVVASCPLPTTLFILVSKSGTTQETLCNELFVKAALKKAGLSPSRHMVAVTSETSPLANNPDYLASFYIDDYIGGRYSSSSAVGGLALSLAYGADVFKDFLNGAHLADKAALESDILKNASLLDALLGVFERNFLHYGATAVLPYSQALSRFPAHLQQLDMESNGKSVNRFGKPVRYATGPLVFGEPGTNGQHSFYQLLHQGTDIVPLQFVGFSEPQRGEDIEIDGSTSHKKLCANLAAQITAFAKGAANTDNLNKNFAGGRPSSLIHGKKLAPAELGALLAHFENKVMFQGFLWNINSFDQEGVQLGKLLTKTLLAGGSGIDGALKAYFELL